MISGKKTGGSGRYGEASVSVGARVSAPPLGGRGLAKGFALDPMRMEVRSQNSEVRMAGNVAVVLGKIFEARI